jgi:hypothetical protein
MPDVDDIMKAMTEATNEMAKWLGGDPSRHGTLRGTFEAALAEAQGAEIMKTRNFTPANPSFSHFDSMRDAANGLQRNLDKFRDLLMQLRSTDPKAAEAADFSFRPLTESAELRVDLARKTEEVIIEIANTRNTTRLEGVPLQQGRDAANLVSNQLRTMNISLVPNQIAQGSNLLDRLRTLPTTLEEARDQLKVLVASVGVAARAAMQAARAWWSRALAVLDELLVAFGSRFTVFLPPIPTDTLKGNRGKGA